MAQEIKRSDIGQNDLFKDITESAKVAKKQLEEFDTVVKTLADDIENKLNKANKTSLEGINSITAAQKKAKTTFEQEVKVKKQLSAIEQEELRLKKQLAKEKAKDSLANSKTAKEIKAIKDERTKNNKAARDEAKANERSKNAYKKLTDETRDLKNESKRLGAEILSLERNGKKNTKEYRALEKQYKQVTKAARMGDDQLKKLDKTVGDNFRNVGNYKSALNGLSNAFGTLGIALGGGAILGGIVNLNRELSKATNTARTFFDTTEEGSKAIAEEASIIAKVYNKEVNEVLKSANALSKEFGITGAEALEEINRGFEKGADVSGEFLSQITEYSTQLRLAGLSADESIAIITQTQREGVFSDKGVDAIKEAVISIREMTPATVEALEAIGMSSEEIQKDISSGTKSYFDVVQEISTRTKEIGENTSEAGTILADVFRGAGEDAGRFIFELGEINKNIDDLADQNKGLDGAIQNLTRSWYDFIYGVNDAGGALDKFSVVINFVAENLGTIFSILTKLAGLYLVFIARQKILNSGIIDYTRNLFKASTAQKGLNNSINESSTGARKFGKSLKNIGWAALIGVVIELAVAFYDVASGAAEARRKAQELDDYTADAAAKSADSVQKYNEEYQQRIFNIQEEERVLLSKAKTEEEANKIRANALEQINKEAEKQAKLFAQLDSQAQSKIDSDKELLSQLEKINQVNGKIVAGELSGQKTVSLLRQAGIEGAKYDATWRSINVTNDELIETKSKLNAKIEATTIRQKNYREALLDSQKILKESTNDIIVDNNERDNNRDKINAQVKGLKDVNKELEKTKKNLTDLRNFDPETNDKPILPINSDEATEEFNILEREFTKSITAINIQQKNGVITAEQAAQMKFDAELEYLKEKKKIILKYGGDFVEINKEISEKELAAQQAAIDAEKERLQQIQNLGEAITDAYVDQVDRRIQALEEERTAAQQQQDFLQELAAQGNIDAQQSLLANQQAQEEIIARQQQLERRKAQIELVTGGLQTYANFIGQGENPAQALTNTLASTQVLVNGLKSIQAFKDGSEDVGSGGNMDKDGGFLAMLHPKERVMTKEQNAKVQGIPNPLLADIGEQFKKGELVRKGGQVGYDTDAIIKELADLKRTVSNKPENYVNFESIAGKMYLNHTRKAGRTTIHNKYKVN